jgi:hypothetical protein
MSSRHGESINMASRTSYLSRPAVPKPPTSLLPSGSMASRGDRRTAARQSNVPRFVKPPEQQQQPETVARLQEEVHQLRRLILQNGLGHLLNNEQELSAANGPTALAARSATTSGNGIAPHKEATRDEKAAALSPAPTSVRMHMAKREDAPATDLASPVAPSLPAPASPVRASAAPPPSSPSLEIDVSSLVLSPSISPPLSSPSESAVEIVRRLRSQIQVPVSPRNDR